MSKPMLTIFTPTYNRAHTLERLYQSLCAQSVKDFEWLLVDDGSTDSTRYLVLSWMGQKNFSIRHILTLPFLFYRIDYIYYTV